MNAIVAITPTPTATDATASLRDTFAAHIVAALIVAPKQPGVPRLEGDGLAKQVYAMADAMMRARTV